MPVFKSFKVKKISLSKNKLASYFEVEWENIKFIPGQFVLIKKNEIIRAYSIASSNYPLRFFVKKVSQNGLSKILVEDLKENDKIYISNALGEMKLNLNFKKYFFFCTWTWLAPFLSIIPHLIEEKKEITLYWWEKDDNFIPPKIKNILKAWSKIITVKIAFSEQWKRIQHLINEKEILSKEKKCLYLCWNPKMVTELSKKFTTPYNKIFYEKY
jgi:ferredoxin-NADP reductase